MKLGYVPIAEAAPLIIAQEKGFFAHCGMTNVEISKQDPGVQPRVALMAVNDNYQCRI